jgi:A118 family predicted phage portal protein
MNVSDICEDVKRIFGSAPAEMSGYYADSQRWRRIYAGEPHWQSVKKSGLYRGGSRRINMLGGAKVLCDRFAVGVFAEEPEIVFEDERCGGFVKDVLQRSNFMSRMNEILSYAFAMGGCVFRPYINGGEVGIDCVFGDGFIPTEWQDGIIRAGVFRSSSVKDGYFYTLYEKRGFEGDTPYALHVLYKSKDRFSPGRQCELGELYPMLSEKVIFEGLEGTNLLSCFKIAGANNLRPEVPMGISAFANAEDTLKALDVAFDSFAREFVLGKKRIIVPSSCVQTVVDIATGEQRQYFDADDEAYVALKCDEERDLKITDNTVELRVDEHIKAINALLNILCFQTGLSAGTFSFDVNEGVKTATEIISRDSRTAATIKAHQNNLGAALKDLFDAVAGLGFYMGKLDSPECNVSIKWCDGIITDENTLIDNSIKLVNSGLKSRVSAIMDVRKCSYDEAVKEYERILLEERG